MRVAVITRSARRAGGLEAYLERAMSLLAGAGHELALFVEHADLPTDRAPIGLPAGVPLAELGGSGVGGLRSWGPEVVFMHGLGDPGLEEAVLDAGPLLSFMHDYHGTCISGSKAFSWPTRRPCDRRFGPACVALYYLRRTGGLDPRTLAREYSRQRRRLGVLRRAAGVCVLSEHMRREAVRHGVAPERARVLPTLLPPPPPLAGPPPPAGDAVRLTFVGRLEPQKGGAELIEGLPAIARRLDRPVELSIAGDGMSRASWEGVARRVTSDRVRVELLGWLDGEELARLYRRSDLLVLPSLWPEPFGLVGLEAGLHGLPVAAFRVGGIGDWLAEGENGALAPGDPPTIEGLVDAVVRCVERPEVLAALREGALRAARSRAPAEHLAALEAALNDAARG